MQDSVVAVDANSGLTFGAGIGTFNLGGLAGIGNFGLADTGGSAVALNVGSAGGDSTYSGNLTGSGSLTKVGSGSLTLSCSSLYYSGPTTVTQAHCKSRGGFPVRALSSPATLHWSSTAAHTTAEPSAAAASLSRPEPANSIRRRQQHVYWRHDRRRRYARDQYPLCPALNLTVDSGAVLDLDGNSITVGNLSGSGTIMNNSWPPCVITLGSNNGPVAFGCAVVNTGDVGVSFNKVGSGATTFQPGTVYNFCAKLSSQRRHTEPLGRHALASERLGVGLRLQRRAECRGLA